MARYQLGRGGWIVGNYVFNWGAFIDTIALSLTQVPPANALALDLAAPVALWTQYPFETQLVRSLSAADEAAFQALLPTIPRG
jgi:hypothetical protein